MNKRLSDIPLALDNLREWLNGKTEFSSHDFIRRFATVAEEQYVRMLYDCVEKGDEHPFQTVHMQIGRELERLQAKLGIEKTDRKMNTNIFGNEDEVQFWNFTG